MYILIVNIDTLSRLIVSGKIRVSYSLIISIGLTALILLAAQTITAMRKQRRINKMKQEASLRDSRISKLGNELKSSSSQIGQLRKELSSTTSRLDCRDKRIESLNKKLAEKSDEMSNLSNEIESLKSILKDTTKTLQEEEKALENANLIIKEKEGEATSRQNEISSLCKKISSLQDSVNSKVQELEVTRNQLLDTENELSMIKVSKESKNDEYSVYLEGKEIYKTKPTNNKISLNFNYTEEGLYEYIIKPSIDKDLTEEELSDRTKTLNVEVYYDPIVNKLKTKSTSDILSISDTYLNRKPKEVKEINPQNDNITLLGMIIIILGISYIIFIIRQDT